MQRFDPEKFEKLLAEYPNAQSLTLTDMLIAHNNINVDNLTKYYPKLKRLHVQGGSRLQCNEIVNAFGDKLEYLYHSHNAGHQTDFSSINFANLQTVVLHTPSAKTVDDILKTGKNIEDIQINPIVNNRPCSLSPQELKTVIPEIFKCESLHTLKVEINADNFMSILEGIEIGLYQTMQTKRKQLKILLVAEKGADIDLKDVWLCIHHIINMLHVLHGDRQPSIVDQFVLIFKSNCEFKKEQIDVVEKQIFPSDIRIYIDKTTMVISNKDCSINGWGNINQYELTY